jgi:hypothetical protein
MKRIVLFLSVVGFLGSSSSLALATPLYIQPAVWAGTNVGVGWTSQTTSGGNTNGFVTFGGTTNANVVRTTVGTGLFGSTPVTVYQFIASKRGEITETVWHGCLAADYRLTSVAFGSEDLGL